MMGATATCYPTGVLLAAPYDPVATPELVDALKRRIPAHSRRYLPDSRAWFVSAAYLEQALAIFRACWPSMRITHADGDGPAPVDPHPPLAEERHYATLHLLPSAPREVIDAAYRALVKTNHPDALPPAIRGRAHQRMVAINVAHEALHAHRAAGEVWQA